MGGSNGTQQSTNQAGGQASGSAPDQSAGSSGSGGKVGKNKVQLAVSVLGGAPGFNAYHSSVVVNDEEFFFSDAGVATTRDLGSHQQTKASLRVIDMGMSQYSGNQLKAALERYFLPGTYDLLRKNCNSFTDCALFYLLHRRLERSYRQLEQLGANNMKMFESLSKGQYTPNPKADDFDLEKLIKDIDPEKVWSTPGQSTGGTNALSAEEMRAARLARLGGGSQPSAAPATPAPAAAAGTASAAAAPSAAPSAAPL